MIVYRIVKSIARTKDLSGTGAFRAAGRWNSKGVYMLYTSENSSLAYLENLVHFAEADIPPNLYIVKIQVDASKIYTLTDSEYPNNWIQIDLPENKSIGDRYMMEGKHPGIKVKSAINEMEYNYLL